MLLPLPEMLSLSSRRTTLVFLSAALAASAWACTLNPQPLPPTDEPKTNSVGHGGGGDNTGGSGGGGGDNTGDMGGGTSAGTPEPPGGSSGGGANGVTPADGGTTTRGDAGTGDGGDAGDAASDAGCGVD